jgi:hypothetical protein
VLASLAQALHRPEGSASYEALRQWVRQPHGVEVKYKKLCTLVHIRFKTKHKVTLLVNVRQSIFNAMGGRVTGAMASVSLALKRPMQYRCSARL